MSIIYIYHRIIFIYIYIYIYMLLFIAVYRDGWMGSCLVRSRAMGRRSPATDGFYIPATLQHLTTWNSIFLKRAQIHANLQSYANSSSCLDSMIQINRARLLCRRWVLHTSNMATSNKLDIYQKTCTYTCKLTIMIKSNRARLLCRRSTAHGTLVSRGCRWACWEGPEQRHQAILVSEMIQRPTADIVASARY